MDQIRILLGKISVAEIEKVQLMTKIILKEFDECDFDIKRTIFALTSKFSGGAEHIKKQFEACFNQSFHLVVSPISQVKCIGENCPCKKMEQSALVIAYISRFNDLDHSCEFCHSIELWTKKIDFDRLAEEFKFRHKYNLL